MLISSIIFLACVSFISALMSVISSLLTLGLLCSSFSSSLRCKVRLFIWDLHWLFLLCALTRDWTHSLHVLGWCSYQPSTLQGSLSLCFISISIWMTYPIFYYRVYALIQILLTSIPCPHTMDILLILSSSRMEPQPTF